MRRLRYNPYFFYNMRVQGIRGTQRVTRGVFGGYFINYTVEGSRHDACHYEKSENQERDVYNPEPGGYAPVADELPKQPFFYCVYGMFAHMRMYPHWITTTMGDLLTVNITAALSGLARGIALPYNL
jgi:hypothetical protein